MSFTPLLPLHVSSHTLSLHMYNISSIVSMLKRKKYGGKEEYKFLEHFATNSKLKV